MGNIDESRAKELFLDALELPLTDRANFVREAAADDTQLASRVHELLASHDRGADLDTPPVPVSTPPERPSLEDPSLEGSSLEPRPGVKIPPYTLGSVIGRGGFGIVFEAHQETPVERTVALKLLKAGMDTASVIARFDAERRALALMEHPCIARVLDAGATPEGRPYFAMELVPGPPLTDFVEHRGLTLVERLELVAQVCDAVQHAHSKGVLHRDIKPSNVLVAEVDGRALPKVIDFGIARAIEGDLAERTRQTQVGELIGTPVAMSPEQAGGDFDVDTRSDVYSLGSLLYEVLTGRPPLDLRGANWTEILRRVREDEPQPPSQASGDWDAPAGAAEIPREIDWVVLRALEKDRERRYPTAAALARDLRRFLTDEPVDAAPPSKSYRVAKFVRRNRAASVAALGITAALLVGVIGTGTALIGQRRATREAVRQTAIAEGVNEFLTEDIMWKLAPTGDAARGKDVSLRAVLDTAVAELDGALDPGGRFEDAPLVVASIHKSAGDVYNELAEYELAEQELRAAFELQARERGPDHEDSISAQNSLAAVLRQVGRFDESERVLEDALSRARRALDPCSVEIRSALRNKAFLHSNRSELPQAIEAFEEALALAEDCDATPLERLSIKGSLAVAHARSTESGPAEQLFREVLDEERVELGARHPRTLASLANLASFLKGSGRTSEAIPLLQEAFDIQSEVLGSTHPDAVTVAANLSDALREVGETKRALELIEPLYTAAEEQYGPENPTALLAASYLGRCLTAVGRLDEAESRLRRSIAAGTEFLGDNDARVQRLKKDLISILYSREGEADEIELERLLNEVLATDIANLGATHPLALLSRNTLARYQNRRGDVEAAEANFRMAEAHATEALGDGHLMTVQLRTDLASLLNQKDRPDEALPFARAAVDGALDSLPETSPDLAGAQLQLGTALFGLGQIDDAEAELIRGHGALEASYGAEHPTTQAAVQRLTTFYEFQERSEEARTWAQRLLPVNDGANAQPGQIGKQSNGE